MAVWQRRARFVVAVFGVACAVIVYFAIGRRPPAVAPAEVKRIDPAATQESVGGNVQRFRGERRDFEVGWDTQLTYPDGRNRMIKTTIRVTKPDGHSYVVTAGEGEATQDQSRFQLSSGVHLEADDGFKMFADRATWTKADGMIHADVPVSFSKGRMSGSGSMVDYNDNSDVLSVAQDARITTADEQGNKILDFIAGSAVLDRYHDVLTLDGHVHVLRDMQVMDADRAVAHLSPNDEFVTFLEMRGSSRVEGGGGSLDAMSARDIDLDYTDDGKQLERVTLTGGAGLTMTGTNGAAGRKLTGESLALSLAPDGAVTSATGRENVQMGLPATATTAARSIKGRTLDSAGAPGVGLTDAHFTENVEYREDATGSSDMRTAHSSRLDLTLSADAVTAATFTGEVTFEEPSFRAQSAEARYDPTAGSLHLTGSDRRGQPCVADDRIAVDAQTIDVTVETRRLTAKGTVKTTLRPAAAIAKAASPCAVGLSKSASTSASASDSKLPGLLKQDQIVNGAADALEYGGTGQSLVFTGTASLDQGSATQGSYTTMRGNVIRVDQEHGNLAVTGGARFNQTPDDPTQKVDARAEEITYTDSKRQIDYRNAPAASTKPGSGTVRVNGPEGNLEANRVEVFLGKDDSRAERIEAYQRVTAKIDTKTMTADRLTYLAAVDEYDMKGAGRVPVKFSDGCLEQTGMTVIYSKKNDSIQSRGENGRTETKNLGCPPSAPSSR